VRAKRSTAPTAKTTMLVANPLPAMISSSVSVAEAYPSGGQ
jgi:hypothetical protein